MKLPSVAVICPTFGRPEFHAQLAIVFASQDYAGPMMLLILDDSREPSPFFTNLRDRRVIYTHHTGARISIGEKRNMLCEQARSIGADVIASFDDDDAYRSDFLRVMCDELRGYDLAKLSVWDVKRDLDSSIWRWDARQTEGVQCVVSGSDPVMCAETKRDEAARDFALYGYGFSYVFRRDLMDRARFPDMNRGEDYAFVKAAMAKGARIKLVANHPDIVLHLVSEKSTSRSFPQWRLDAPRPPTQASTIGNSLSFDAGKSYSVKAVVKREHTIAELKMRARAFGLEVLNVAYDVEPDERLGWPPDVQKPDGYRFVLATVKATRNGSLPTSVPAPLSWFDASCVVAARVVG